MSGLLPVSLFSLRVPDLLRLAVWFLVLSLIFKAFKLYLNWKELDKIYGKFPGPKPHWLYGNALEFLNSAENLPLVRKWASTYVYGFPLWLGKVFATLIITHPEYVKTVLARQDPKDDVSYGFVSPWIGDGLLVTSGSKWFHHRRLLTPAFHYEILKPYVALMADCTKTMLDKWEPLIPHKKSIDISHDASLMTLDTVMKCAFSYNSNCQIESDNDYIKAVYDLSLMVDTRFRNFLYHNNFLYHLSPQGYNFRKSVGIAQGHTDNVIKKRKESLLKENQLEKISQKRHLDFLDILLCAKDERGEILCDKDLRAEVDSFMFAGHHTTGSANSWIIYCMGKYPEYQQRCYEEIREVLGDRDTIEWEDIGKLTFTTMFIKETLRLYPPVPGIGRRLSKPLTFFDGRSLPAGSLVLLSLYCINRCPSIWKDSEVFDPLRFSPENSSERHSHAFIPFSAGPRNCIGQTFAMNELKVCTALVLKRYQIIADPDNEPQIISQVVLRSVNGIHVYLKKREE